MFWPDYEDWYGEPVDLRLKEAKFFLQEHAQICASTEFDYFRAVAMADASLFTLISIKDLVSEEIKKKLESDSLFSMLQCMRNLTAHKEVWPSRTALSRRSRGSSVFVELLPNPVKLDESLQVLAQTPRNKKATTLAREYLRPRISGDMYGQSVAEMLQDGITLVENTIEAASQKCFL